MVSAGPLSSFISLSQLTDGPLSRSSRPTAPWIELPRALAWFRLPPCLVVWDFGWPPVWFYRISKFRLALCLVLWDFKTDGWPPVPISNPSRRPTAPWIELPRALAWFRLPPCLVVWDFGWHPVWLYGISAGPLSGFMGFQN